MMIVLLPKGPLLCSRITSVFTGGTGTSSLWQVMIIIIFYENFILFGSDCMVYYGYETTEQSTQTTAETTQETTGSTAESTQGPQSTTFESTTEEQTDTTSEKLNDCNVPLLIIALLSICLNCAQVVMTLRLWSRGNILGFSVSQLKFIQLRYTSHIKYLLQETNWSMANLIDVNSETRSQMTESTTDQQNENEAFEAIKEETTESLNENKDSLRKPSLEDLIKNQIQVQRLVPTPVQTQTLVPTTVQAQILVPTPVQAQILVPTPAQVKIQVPAPVTIPEIDANEEKTSGITVRAITSKSNVSIS